MILEYHRPQTMEEALGLLARPAPRTVPLGGGTMLAAPGAGEVAVVDLQDLPLGAIEPRGNELQIGATATLAALLAQDSLPGDLARTVRLETTANLRQVATVAGTLVSADGRSPFTTALLALDAMVALQPGDELLGLGDLLPVRKEALEGRLITGLVVGTNLTLACHQTARTPADWPLVCVALARWPSGRTRVALGGHGPAPILAFDGPDPDGLEEAVKDAFSRAGDEWASAAYRQEVALVLARRSLGQVRPGVS